MAGAWRHRRPDPSHLHGSKVRFARDSPLEGAGFEPSVPRERVCAFRNHVHSLQSVRRPLRSKWPIDDIDGPLRVRAGYAAPIPRAPPSQAEEPSSYPDRNAGGEGGAREIDLSRDGGRPRRCGAASRETSAVEVREHGAARKGLAVDDVRTAQRTSG